MVKSENLETFEDGEFRGEIITNYRYEYNHYPKV